MTQKIKKEKELFPDRVRFNWGYHDAQFDIKRGCTRRLSEKSHNIGYVGKDFDAAYYYGYKSRLEENKNGIKYNNSSNNAWKNRESLYD